MKNEEHFETSKMKNLKRGTKLLKSKGVGWGHIVFSKKQKKKLKMQNEMPRNEKNNNKHFFYFNKIS